MTTFNWRPSPALADATADALQTLARHWPRTFALANDASDAGRAFLTEYAFALSGVDVRAIPEAVRRWIAKQNYGPRAAELAEIARTVAREMRSSSGVAEPLPEVHAPPIRTTRRTDLMRVIGETAYAELGSWRLVSEMWALLQRTAPNEAARAAVFDGTVPLSIVDDAIAAVKREHAKPPERGNITQTLMEQLR